MGARILIIEDNRTNLELMSYLLNAFGNEVETAENGRAGIEKATSRPPDLVICDILMPDLSGYDVARTMKSIASLERVPLVAVTALAMVDDRRKVMAAGFDGYVTKPIEPENFIGQLAPFLPSHASAVPRPGGRTTTAAPSAQRATPNARQILVVDNSADNLSFARDLLEATGYAVATAMHIEEALTLVKLCETDLVLSDLHMPNGSGFDLLRAMKADARLREIPFVVLTSSIWGEIDVQRALQLGADRCLMRGIAPQALVAEIQSVLERSGEQ